MVQKLPIVNPSRECTWKCCSLLFRYLLFVLGGYPQFLSRRLFIHFSVHPLVNNVFLENCNFLHGYNSIKMTRQVFSQKIINTKIKIIIKKLFDKRSNYESKMACLVCFFGTTLFFTGISCAWLGWIWSNVFTLNFAKWASKLSETENR